MSKHLHFFAVGRRSDPFVLLVVTLVVSRLPFAQDASAFSHHEDLGVGKDERALPGDLPGDAGPAVVTRLVYLMNDFSDDEHLDLGVLTRFEYVVPHAFLPADRARPANPSPRIHRSQAPPSSGMQVVDHSVNATPPRGEHRPLRGRARLARARVRSGEDAPP